MAVEIADTLDRVGGNGSYPLVKSEDASYSNEEKTNATNVKDALDELYNRCAESNGFLVPPIDVFFEQYDDYESGVAFTNTELKFKIHASEDWITTNNKSEDYYLMIFTPSYRRKKWVPIYIDTFTMASPTDARKNNLIGFKAADLESCIYENGIFTANGNLNIMKILKRFIIPPKDVLSYTLRGLLKSGCNGEYSYQRRGSGIYILGEDNSNCFVGNSTNKKTNGFSANFKIGLSYKTPLDSDYIPPSKLIDFKAHFGLKCKYDEKNKSWSENKLYCTASITKNRFQF